MDAYASLLVIPSSKVVSMFFSIPSFLTDNQQANPEPY